LINKTNYNRFSHLSQDGSKGLYSIANDHDSCGVGLLVQMKGKKSHKIIRQALDTLTHLEHRGACGCEVNTGDGAGILIQMPHEFFTKECEKLKIHLPKEGEYGCGVIFLPQDKAEQKRVEGIFNEIVKKKGQILLGWRKVPIDDSMIGKSARDPMPVMKQVFIGVGPKGPGLPGSTVEAFERRLFIIRKCFEREICKADLNEKNKVYICSLSSRVLVYKGMLISHQVKPFFPDLQNSTLKSAIAMVHSRFSTNTLPRWELAQPFRFLCHNGEINTLRGNINWMRAREALFESKLFGNELNEIFPVITEGCSDSATFDNALELLMMGGYSLPHAVMMMIPEAWSGHQTMSQSKKDFYAYHSCLMEPWDGPAYIGFTDGKIAGAVLDRNGLRPGRYYVTKDDLVILASEVGVVDEIEPEDVVLKGRLQPGRMFLVDTTKGRIIEDEEIKSTLSTQKPYGDWLKKEMVLLENLPRADQIPEPNHDTVTKRQMVFGYTQEDLKILMLPMAQNGMEGIGSMGTDTPLAVLSERPQTLFYYFKQLFAQVTNPPLDSIREEAKITRSSLVT